MFRAQSDRMKSLAHALPPHKQPIMLCEEGHHCAKPQSKHVVNGVTRAECRYCGCDLMRMAASRRWFRCGEMGG
jgi:hypothetical protein